jgi:CHAD domain-containing protein
MRLAFPNEQQSRVASDMAFRIDFSEPLNDEVRRIHLEQIDRALAEIDDDSLSVHARVHQFRKRGKKIRALARLFRDADESWYKSVNVQFRDMARNYADLRDAQAVLETYDGLEHHFSAQLDSTTFAPIRESLLSSRGRRIRTDTDGLHLPSLRDALSKSRAAVGDWPRLDLDDRVMVQGVARTYKRARKGFKKANPCGTASDWHEWRKRVKYQRYELKLLRGIWPTVVNCWRAELHRLSDLIGREHDLETLRLRIAEGVGDAEEPALEVVRGLIRQRRLDCRDLALALGQMLYTDKTRIVEERLGKWLSCAR